MDGRDLLKSAFPARHRRARLPIKKLPLGAHRSVGEICLAAIPLAPSREPQTYRGAARAGRRAKQGEVRVAAIDRRRIHPPWAVATARSPRWPASATWRRTRRPRVRPLFLHPCPFWFLDIMCFVRAIALGGCSDLMDLRVFSVQGASLRPTRRP